MTSEHNVQNFARLMEALRPWLPHVVIVGGWAHRLHRLHSLAQPLAYPPLMTRDADIAIPVVTPPGAPDLGQRLLEHGFELELLGDHKPPVSRYRLGDEEQGFYAEFLTPLVGSQHKRDETPGVAVRVAGVTAQTLRHLEILLIEPWSVVVDSSRGFPLKQAAVVRVPNAVTYVAHKLLIHAKRKPEERAKDVLYIHDTFETFAGSLEDLRQIWLDTVKPSLHPNRVRDVHTVLRRLFADVSDTLRCASRIATAIGRTISAESILEVCQVECNQVFGKGAGVI